jgi:hypothetical protein
MVHLAFLPLIIHFFIPRVKNRKKNSRLKAREDPLYGEKMLVNKFKNQQPLCPPSVWEYSYLISVDCNSIRRPSAYSGFFAVIRVTLLYLLRYQESDTIFYIILY